MCEPTSGWRLRSHDPDAFLIRAPGDTKGSRHCVAPCRGQFYRFGGDDLSDLCFEAYETWTMQHPEHGHVTAAPRLYQFCHEQNEQNMRVRD